MSEGSMAAQGKGLVDPHMENWTHTQAHSKAHTCSEESPFAVAVPPFFVFYV